MPPSPSQAADNGSNNDTKPHATNGNFSHSYSIVRFLADQQQYHPVFSKVQSPTDAEAIAEARVEVELRAFEKKLGLSGKTSSS
ncbi:hypothetical protein T069G_08631 [Trichoderma breve]|uniref:Uncharacterized protein n=1 Tax=Trichoderma breve TaxID=2034170 RepID=A0A9W9E4D5_9HYPO|nr:hypothetical protein T069G_08631 [Trichoderma breve]KAJ4857734.1 hypothetical protein T069G_08631 [Trichoderma breve]